MRKKALLVLLLFIGLANASYAFSLPEHDNYVTDLANILSTEEEQILENNIYTLWKNTGNEIAVVILSSTQWEDIAMLATDIGNARWVGNKKFDNGIVILIAIEDRKWFTAVGYWLEGTLPDAITKRIWQKNFPDNFRQQQYYQWIIGAINDIVWYLNNDPTIKEYYEGYEDEETDNKYDGVMLILWIILAAIFLKGKKELRKKALLFLWLWWVVWTVFWLLLWGIVISILSAYAYLLIGIIVTQGKLLWILSLSWMSSWWKWWFWWWWSFWWFWWGSFWWWWSWWSR